MQIRVHVTYDKTVRELKKLRSLMENWKDELGDIGDYLERFFSRDVFETEGGVYGGKWQRLSYKYEEQKRRKYAGRGVLERTGKMRKAWKKDVSATRIQLYNTTDYAIKHQEGKGVPKRAIIQELPSQQIRHIHNMFNKGVIKRVEQAA